MSDAYYKPLGLPEIEDAVSTPEDGIARLFVRAEGELSLKESSSFEHSFANVTPEFIADGKMSFIRQNLQMLYSEPITLDGELVIDGQLIEIA
jgi:hypothetical protein